MIDTDVVILIYRGFNTIWIWGIIGTMFIEYEWRILDWITYRKPITTRSLGPFYIEDPTREIGPLIPLKPIVSSLLRRVISVTPGS